MDDLPSLKAGALALVGQTVSLRQEPARTRKLRRELAFVAWVLRALQYGCLIGAFAASMFSIGYLIWGEKATGVVAERVAKGGGFEDADFSVVYTIEFDGPQGERIRFKTSSSATDRSIGEKVPVIYFAADTSWVRIDDFNVMWGLTIGLLVIGIALAPFAWIAKHLTSIWAFAQKR